MSYMDKPLLMAARKGHVGVLRMLLAIDEVDVDPTESILNMPFLLAARNGHREVIEVLLSTGRVRTDVRDGNGDGIPRAAEDGIHEGMSLGMGLK